MKEKMLLKKLTLILIVVFAPLALFSKQSEAERNFIHGKHHIFSVKTPQNWINDKQRAQEMNLVSFFYPKADTSRGNNVFIYAMGYDKTHESETLDDFIAADIKTFKKHNPKLTLKKIPGLGIGAILKSQTYAFENLSQRYKEEVAYLETKHTIIVLVFSSLTKESYTKNVEHFDKFITSFYFIGHDPKKFFNKYDLYENLKVGMSGLEVFNLLGSSIDASKDLKKATLSAVNNLIKKMPNEKAKKYYIWKKPYDENTYFIIGFDNKENVAVKHKLYILSTSKK